MFPTKIFYFILVSSLCREHHRPTYRIFMILPHELDLISKALCGLKIHSMKYDGKAQIEPFSFL